MPFFNCFVLLIIYGLVYTSIAPLCVWFTSTEHLVSYFKEILPDCCLGINMGIFHVTCSHVICSMTFLEEKLCCIVWGERKIGNV